MSSVYNNYNANGYFNIEWIEVPAGEFWMGDNEIYNSEPAHKVSLDRYWISKTPITNQQYRFVDRKNLDNHPVVLVDWYDAIGYCQWLSKEIGEHVTLPSEAEWEKAARGDMDRRKYPWGDNWGIEYCNTHECGYNDSTTVGLFSPFDASPYGCTDMAGNVWEWTRSLWGKDFIEPEFQYPYIPDDGREYTSADRETLRVLRGGSFMKSRYYAQCSYRHSGIPTDAFPFFGFRVVMHDK